MRIPGWAATVDTYDQMEANTRHQQRFPGLTGVRFPLALWVVSYHLSGPGHLWERLSRVSLAQTVVSQAYVALGTFFAISGFVLGYAYLDGSWSSRKTIRYFAARIARISPLYYFSLLILAPIIYRQLRVADLGSTLDRAGILFDYLLLLQGWLRLPVDWNTPAWSLSCELFFYSCFPLAARYLPKKGFRAVLLLAAAAFGIPVIARLLHAPTEWKPLTYAGDFIVGMACAAFYRAMEGRSRAFAGRGYLLYVPAVLLGAALLICDGSIPWLAFDESMRVANAALVLGLAYGGGLLDRLLSSAVVFAGGAASFSIYILHIPLLWWFKRTVLFHALPPEIAGFVYVGGVILLAFAASRWIETPANTVLREKLSCWLSAVFAPGSSPQRKRNGLHPPGPESCPARNPVSRRTIVSNARGLTL